ncbi:hypothetical protein [Planctomyces sp. SH-PL14]|uniref:hypothetical protein n=1 Tax=Planctomyces sp. SH-PL14 TaxID=1632864 RepID=UPI00078E9B1E|nr:hypothetical protein [Planctomyces sp. SH-PL14]AMV22562.1 hypothetical protein VT03_31995 [Planctomyces sp. SH-PL14]
MSESPSPFSRRFSAGPWVLVSVAFLIPLAWSALTRLRVDHAPTAALKASAPEVEQLRAVHEQFPASEGLLVGCDNATLQDPRLPLVKERLLGTMGEDGIRRGGSPYIASIDTVQDRMAALIESGVSPQQAYDRLIGSLVGTGRLRVTLTPQGRENVERTEKQIVAAVEQHVGQKVRVVPPTTPFFAEEDDARFADIEVTVPKGTPAWTADGVDLELAWDGMHSQTGLETIRTVLLGVTGYATMDEPAGARLLAEAGFLSGSATAMEIHLSEAGRLAPQAALSDIRTATAACAITPEHLVLSGDVASTVNQNLAFAGQWTTPFGSAWVVAAMLIAAAGIALSALLRSPVRGLASVGLTTLVAVVAVAIATIAGLTFNATSLLLLLPVLFAALPLTTGVFTPGNSTRRGALLAAVVLAISLLPLLAAATLAVRGFAVAMAASMALIALAGLSIHFETAPTRPRAESEGPVAAVSRWLAGPGRRVGVALMVLAVGCAVGVGQLRTQRFDAAPLLTKAPLDDAQSRWNDVVGGAQDFDIVVRFSPETTAATKFLERMELVRSLQGDLRAIPDVRSVSGLTDLYPAHTLPSENASPRERSAFHRVSRGVEEQCTAETHTLARMFLAAGSPSDPKRTEAWRIRVSTDAAASTEDLAQRLNHAVQTRTRFEPGVTHTLAGAALIENAAEGLLLRGLLMVSIVSVALSVLGMIILTGTAATAPLVAIPCVLTATASLGAIAFSGRPLDLTTAVAGLSAILFCLQAASRCVLGYLSDLRAGVSRQEATTHVVRSLLGEQVPNLFALTLPAIFLGDYVPQWLAEFSEAALAIGFSGTILLATGLPVLLASSLAADLLRVGQPAPAPQPELVEEPLRRSA